MDKKNKTWCPECKEQKPRCDDDLHDIVLMRIDWRKASRVHRTKITDLIGESPMCFECFVKIREQYSQNAPIFDEAGNRLQSISSIPSTAASTKTPPELSKELSPVLGCRDDQGEGKFGHCQSDERSKSETSQSKKYIRCDTTWCKNYHVNYCIVNDADCEDRTRYADGE